MGVVVKQHYNNKRLVYQDACCNEISAFSGKCLNNLPDGGVPFCISNNATTTWPCRFAKLHLSLPWKLPPVERSELQETYIVEDSLVMQAACILINEFMKTFNVQDALLFGQLDLTDSRISAERDAAVASGLPEQASRSNSSGREGGICSACFVSHVLMYALLCFGRAALLEEK